ncbi:MAG: glycosyltransferase [Acidimicrobiia bacterium]|nr:glycosyltransferase [Acidimicrobiia bacterium]
MSQYPVRLLDPDDPGRPPEPVPFARALGATLRGGIHRAVKGRRLAIVDTHLPWRISGFRFREFAEMSRQRPDLIGFSLWGIDEAFDAPVHPLSQFPLMAAQLGVTDVYLVFLNWTASVLGLSRAAEDAGVGGLRHDVSLWPWLRRNRIRVHATIYPGGGLVPDTPPWLLRLVASRCATVFTNVAEVESAVAKARFTPVSCDTDFYRLAPRPSTGALHIAFAAADRPRKGLQTLIEAFNILGDDDRFHLHLVGPHDKHLPKLTNRRFSAHGWLQPEELRAVYERCHVFASPVTRDDVDAGEGAGMVDGFPTTAATDAMATGAALVSSNPRREHRVFEPGRHYVEVPERDPGALASALRAFADDRDELAALSRRGADRVRERMSASAIVSAKLDAIAGSLTSGARRTHRR